MRKHILTALLLAVIISPPVQAQGQFEALDNAIEAGEFGDITAIYVEGADGVVHERYFDGDETTLRNTRSVTKTITGALLGIAIAEGHIASLDARVLSFFPDRDIYNPSARKSAMTLRDLLTMTGPLECNDWNNLSEGNEERMYLREDWEGFFLNLPSGAPAPWEARAEDRPHGTVFSYCTAGVFTLGRIIELATGRDLEAYAQEKLFEPLGIGAVKWAYSPRDIAQGGGGLEMTARDLAAFARVYLQGDAETDAAVLSSEWIKASVTASAQIDERTDYGYLWWLYDMPGSGTDNAMWMMNGSGGNKIVVLPELDAVAVITTTNFRRRDAHELSDAILTEHIIPALNQ